MTAIESVTRRVIASGKIQEAMAKLKKYAQCRCYVCCRLRGMTLEQWRELNK